MTINSNTKTDYTSPSLPVCLSRGVVPSAIESDLNSDPYKTRSSNLVFSPRREEGSKTKNSFYPSSSNMRKEGSNNNPSEKFHSPRYSKKLQLYLPGLMKSDVSPQRFKKLALNSNREKLPRLK